MNNEVFEAQVLGEKLSKLNNSQQSIESLSRWCISHRKKAKQIVETWDKLFNSSQQEQRVSFLYLANDILQNSRRKGSEFVNEFWKVLPGALKYVYDQGDESGKKAAARLVNIWEERKVFGSRGQNLKDEMLGKYPPPTPLPSSNGKSSNPKKIVKRDAHSVRIKLAVGGVPERILTAFQSVLDEHLTEDAALNDCSSATHHLNQIEEDLNASLAQGTQPRSALLDDLQEQENVIQRCIRQLESVEATRASLVSLLVEALLDQESKLELVRNQLQIARSQIELASNVRKRSTSTTVPGPSATNINVPTETTHVIDTKLSSVQQNAIASPVQAMVSFAGPKTSEDETKRAAAAAVAAKLAASTSSAQMLTSVLSSLVAEEAASMNGSLKSSGFASLSILPSEKRQKIEKPMPISDVSSSDGIGASFITPMQQQQLASVPLAQSANGQPVSQANLCQASFAPPPPPAPPSLSSTPSVNQYGQSGGLMGVSPYSFGAYSLPPPPPLPPHIAMGLSRPMSQPPQQQPQPQLTLPTSAGFYRPPGIGFYGQGQQSTPPPVPRQ
ncbi:regulation of nuclear pre-mRNA domain-containing protein 1A-like isoform X1 [Cucurbita maxima]|uniref:Regulation of nuclear pre-mRNA domain-containing protein 1A-like isoform X1 n=1 Tax=Cucurbita maxima TaxID=3661 RepID=A0A6J1J690_CUCMA|nr:regulation of nuclear pre-mRNA domain-containing protein 1A-like isoform X1 [Cucurbita maxima]